MNIVEWFLVYIKGEIDMKAFIATLLSLMLLLSGCGSVTTLSPSTATTDYDMTIVLPSDRYPETIAHIAAAIKAGASAICTIDRNGAEENRSASLSGVPTKKGFDRDEWPMAMCAEGGEGADIAYVTPKDNRGAGSWIGNKLDKFEDGTRILFQFEENDSSTSTTKPIATEEPNAAKKDVPTTVPPSIPTVKPTVETTTVPTAVPTTKSTSKPSEAPATKPTAEPEVVYYANCAAVREAGAAPIHKGDPGYSKKLDRDGDGIGCE